MERVGILLFLTLSILVKKGSNHAGLFDVFYDIHFNIWTGLHDMWNDGLC